ncbi:MAG: hypothetical protein Q8O83_00400 [bacterium]|nr:hypothetical protein [bacterium]
MSSFKGTMKAKIASTVLSVTTALWLGGIGYLIPVAAQAQTVADLQAQIQALLAQIATLQTQLSGLSGGSSGFSHVFNTNLSMGMTSDEVKALQQALDLEGCFTFGSYTGYFGPITRDAANCFQNKYASEVLTPLGLSAPTGFVGAGTRAKLNALFGTPTTPTTPTTPVSAGSLLVAAGTQPADSLAVKNAQGVPFTVITLSAGASDVIVDSVTVERQGLGADSAFSGVVLIDSDGTRIGLSKSLNSLHQATLTEDFTIKAGTTKTVTVGGDMAASLSANVGEAPILAVTAIALKGTATLEGSLPIKGAIHTANNSLTIGSVTNAIGPLDPGSSVNKKVGETAYTFTSVKFTAGSAEDLLLKNIRFNQSGSAASSDLANVKIVVDGTAYDAKVSDDGKYYSASFGAGVSIAKGFSTEVSVKGDIVDGSSRTIDFDIFRRTDVTFYGKTFGYNISPPNGTDASGTDDGAFHEDTNPWFDGYQVTIDTGTLTVENSSAVQSQNVAENVPDQAIGGFNVEIKGEEISVAQIIFGLGTTGTGDPADLTNISLVRDDGVVLAGPADGVVVSGSYGTVTFTETIIFPVGKKTYTLKGKYGSDFDNNDTVHASTTPSTQWTTVTGQTTSVSITPSPSSAISGNTMTLKAAAVTISVSSVPLAQNVVAGTSDFLFANYELDATNSGDDIRFASLPLEYGTPVGGTATNLTACKLYDGATIVSDGVDPSAVGSSTSFTFLGSGLIVPKGTVKTIGLKCNISTGAAANTGFRWGYSTASSPTPTGVTSGQSATVTENGSGDGTGVVGQTMTVQTGGTYTVTDDSTPGYSIVQSGTTGVTLAKLKFSASFEDIDIRRVNFELSAVATNSPIDLIGQKVSLYDGSTWLADATFGANGDFATSSVIASGAFRVPKDSSKTMTVKGDIGGITVSGPLVASGDFLQVQWDAGALGLSGGNYGVGVGSGSNISPTGSDTTITGVRIMKSYPSFAKIDLSTSERTMQTGSDRTIYKFKVTAVGNDVQLYKFTFQLSSSTGNLANASTSGYSVYAFTDSSFASPDTSFSTTGLLNAENCAYPTDAILLFGGMFKSSDKTAAVEATDNVSVIGLDNTDINVNFNKTTCGTATTTYKIPSGETRWFRFAADVYGVETSSGEESFEVRLMGDAAYPTATPHPDENINATDKIAMASATFIDTDTNDDLIWSPNSTTTSIALTDLDFTNGYLVPGLPTTNMSFETLTSSN